MKKKNYKPLFISAFIGVILAGIFLPGILLHYTFQSDLNKISSVPKEYYISSSVISKNASAKLTEYEKMKLISGAWESIEKPVDSNQSNITELEAANLAKAAVEELYQNLLYPYHFESSYGNWYSWDASLYQCTEINFNTYTTYYWLITFYKYDSSETHKVLITENGTLLSVGVNRALYSDNNNITQNARAYFKQKYKPGPTPVSLLRITEPNDLPSYRTMTSDTPYYYYAYAMAVGSSQILTWEDFNKANESGQTGMIEKYCVYQCSSKGNGMITIIPWE